MYQRKTRDRWDLVTNYGYGWEVEVSEYTAREIKQRMHEYVANARGLVGIRIEKHREAIA